KVRISGGVNRERIATAQQFDQEGIVIRGRDVGELFVCVRPLVHDPEIELFDVPGLRLIEVLYADADMVAAPACERRSGVFWGEFEVAHDCSPLRAIRKFPAT